MSELRKDYRCGMRGLPFIILSWLVLALTPWVIIIGGIIAALKVMS